MLKKSCLKESRDTWGNWQAPCGWEAVSMLQVGEYEGGGGYVRFLGWSCPEGVRQEDNTGNAARRLSWITGGMNEWMGYSPYICMGYFTLLNLLIILYSPLFATILYKAYIADLLRSWSHHSNSFYNGFAQEWQSACHHVLYNVYHILKYYTNKFYVMWILS